MNNLCITDVGPIEALTIPVPEDGGVVVLRGSNGTGKTHALSAVGALLGSKGKPTTRDGSLGAVVEGLGARLTVGRRATRSGQIEIGHLEGEDPSLLVDPGLKDPASADAERIRALLRLSRAKVDLQAFAELVGGEERLREICRESTLEATDVPSMAAAVKRDLEAAARKHEGEATNLSNQSKGVASTLREMFGDITPSEDGEALSLPEARSAQEEAIRQSERADATQKSARKRIEAANIAKTALEEMGDAGTKESIKRVEAEVSEISTELRRIRSELREAETREAKLDFRVDSHRVAASQREAFESSIAAAADAVLISDEEIETLTTKADEARDAVERAQMLERSAGLQEESKRLSAKAEAATLRGVNLRAAARGTENIITEAVAEICTEDMSIREGRLMVHSPRGFMPFAELSSGERWRRAMDIAVASVGEGGLLVVRQEAWEGLDPQNRAEIAGYAKKLRTVIITAEADDGEIRAEALDA